MTKKFKIGIDYGGTKIEGILLNESGEQIERKRYSYDRNYESGIDTIKKLVNEFDKISGESCTVGIGIPGFSSKETGLITNANSLWLNDKPFNKDLEKKLNRTVKLMNDANCFTLSEAIDGAGKHYKIVFGVILGSGVGGGLVIDKKIVTGLHGITGEWGHNQLPIIGKDKIIKKTNLREGEIENSISGLSLAKNFKKIYNKDLTAGEIFELYRSHDLDAEKIIDEFKDNLAMSIASVVNILDPDVFIFGGGLSNEIDFFDEIQSKVKKFVAGNEFEGIMLKPKFGDASGVRGAARLGRKMSY